jgi:hypothetical protein
VSGQAFADESFKINDPHGLVTLAELPVWSDIRWHRELVRICGTDAKWGQVRQRWDDLSHDLRRSIVRTLRDALITIIEPSLYRFELEKLIVNAVGQPKRRWPEGFSKWVEEQLAQYERQRILSDSPVLQIQRFLEDDGLTLGGLGGIEGNVDESRSVPTDISDALKSAHTVRLFGARSASAFSVLVDHGQWQAALDELWEMRYLSKERVVAHLLAAAERIQRVFDEGNQPSVLAISRLKESVRIKLASSGLIVMPSDVPAGAIEQSSVETPELQVADLAAGYARQLYVGSDGLRIVREEFRAVILNGAMVADGQQLDRQNLAELRATR